MCIFMILSVILLFSLTEGSNFNESSSYQFLEWLIVFSILLATATELFYLFAQTFVQIATSNASIDGHI